MTTMNKHDDLGFNTPDGYFESLETRLLGAKNNVSHAGFDAPDQYFEQLESRLFSPNEQEHQVVTLPATRKPWLLPLLAAAAMLAVVVTLRVLINDTPKKQEMTFASVAHDELMEYILKQPQLEDTHTLSFLFETTALPESPSLVDAVDDDVLIDYLINNQTESSFLD